MMTRQGAMADLKRLFSAVLLAFGVILVFAGMSSALGFTPGGMVASVAVIGALLYAGAVWFGPPSAAPPPAGPRVIVFDRSQRIVAGEGRGEPLTAGFPDSIRAELRQRCDAALDGTSARFVCDHAGAPTAFDAVPVRTSDGTIAYGILLIGVPAPAPLPASRATTVA
jgi:hypothetical protein